MCLICTTLSQPLEVAVDSTICAEGSCWDFTKMSVVQEMDGRTSYHARNAIKSRISGVSRLNLKVSKIRRVPIKFQAS